MTTQPHIFAVVVLYRKLPAESEAFVSLRAILNENKALAARFNLLLYDHSPAASTLLSAGTLPCPSSYVHDPSNSGLCTAFNYALGQAVTHACEWLLLLDHDTTLTRDYVTGLVAAIDRHEPAPQKNSRQPSQTPATIGAFVPLLEFEGSIYSPEETFTHHLRHQFPQIRYYRCSASTQGLQTRPLNAYNSGAALRVSALLAIGGFPVEFPLDYLDFAVFHLLQARGYTLYVIDQQLHQQLSHGDLDQVSFSRHTSVMQSQARFVALYGTLLDRLLFKLWLARMSRRYRQSCRDPRVWKNMLRQSLGLRLLS